MDAIFLYGTLCHEPLRNIVLGNAVTTQPARLDGHAAFMVRGESFPMIVPRAGKDVPGLLVRPSAAARRDGVRVLFVQPQFSRREAQTVARELSARVVALDPLARDYPDNLRRMARAVLEGLADDE